MTITLYPTGAAPVQGKISELLGKRCITCAQTCYILQLQAPSPSSLRPDCAQLGSCAQFCAPTLSFLLRFSLAKKTPFLNRERGSSKEDSDENRRQDAQNSQFHRAY